jgi:hypothetical protein
LFTQSLEQNVISLKHSITRPHGQECHTET